MPAGIPVATVAIGNATNAGLLAARMLATSDLTLSAKLAARQDAMRDKVLAKADDLEQRGWKAFMQPAGAKPVMLPQFAASTALEPVALPMIIGREKISGFVTNNVGLVISGP